MAYENSCCLRDGFLAYPMIRDPKTDPIPAPEPAAPTVAAPAPMNLAAVSMSRLAVEVCKPRNMTMGPAALWAATLELRITRAREAGRAKRAAYILRGGCLVGIRMKHCQVTDCQAWDLRVPM